MSSFLKTCRSVNGTSTLRRLSTLSGNNVPAKYQESLSNDHSTVDINSESFYRRRYPQSFFRVGNGLDGKLLDSGLRTPDSAFSFRNRIDFAGKEVTDQIADSVSEIEILEKGNELGKPSAISNAELSDQLSSVEEIILKWILKNLGKVFFSVSTLVSMVFVIARRRPMAMCLVNTDEMIKFMFPTNGIALKNTKIKVDEKNILTVEAWNGISWKEYFRKLFVSSSDKITVRLLLKGVRDVLRGKLMNPDVPRYYFYKKLRGDANFEKCVPKIYKDDGDLYVIFTKFMRDTVTFEGNQEKKPSD